MDKTAIILLEQLDKNKLKSTGSQRIIKRNVMSDFV